MMVVMKTEMHMF